MSKILELREKRAKAWEAAKAFLDAKRTQEGFVSAEDAATYDKMENDVVNLGKEIERLERQAAIDAELSKATSTPITNKPDAKTGGDTKTGRATDEYRKAFWNGMRNKVLSYEVQNALTIGTDSEGGYLVPDEYEKKLVEALEERFKVTCFVGHDIRSLALAEHYFGASQDCEDSILVRVHRGTGAGIISNGRIFIGRNGNVGEIGHIQVEPLGERCHCGNFGCLETIAANAAIEQRVLNLLKQGYQSRVPLDDCTIKTICKAANKGDSLASEVIEYVGRHLGKTIAIAINLFNPQKIVIAGEITEADKVLLPAIESCINTQALKAFRTNLPVVRSELDHRSAIGAFALVKRAMLNGILLQHLLEN